MSLPTFIAEELADAAVGHQVTLSGAEGRHAVTVKRIQAGEQVMLADGAGRFVTVTVTATEGKDTLHAHVDEVGEHPQPEPRVVVVQAIPKSERAELAVDLATQAGADEIIAWQAERCVAKWDAKKAPKALAKWQQAARAAAKQSRRARIPQVRGPLTTAELASELRSHNEAHAYVLHEDATTSIRDAELTGTVYLIVGPEGGIGASELAQLEATGARAVTLGPEVYRTASAAMVGLSAIGVLTSRW
ncbi:16S rRNA (uracil(1498)-N(3))-methyltransferase [Corynebacterium incognita]|uniref:Ribosomal RNA small subunit methyltransferase E n=1 Tax=Corynebacterium incognita TaxID=2754725 RepID=A0A7G7CQW4_9CORY|nr:16S rRNA (uracil(1498)-N(3))-methyltransferase [Corynebacterium incognita]QNE89980.1 16S rRNA (uracil(1498)-N(3))-methyltransferase [Corynebacterium incognita]